MKWPIAPAVAALIGAVLLAGCTTGTGVRIVQDGERAAVQLAVELPAWLYKWSADLLGSPPLR